MKYTSAEANKALKKLQEEEARLIAEEQEGCKFEAAMGEDIEDAMPEYRFSVTQARLEEIRTKILIVKHAINAFNVKTVVADGLTIDQALVLLPKLNDRKRRLAWMMTIPKKKRVRVYGSGAAGIIDYQYANFSADEVAKAYVEVSAKIDEIQLALDHINVTETFSIAGL